VTREIVEIYSYWPNKIVLRVPWARYPGILIQADDLTGLRGAVDRACLALQSMSETDPTKLSD
jgi:hypothetical protein